MNKNWMKRMMAALVCMMLAFASPAVAFAAQSTASNLKELARAVAQHGMNREKTFDVKYTGAYDDVLKLIEDVDLDFFYSTMMLEDDPTTSDDADYLVGNIDYSVEDFTYSADVDGVLTFSLPYFETLDQTKYVNEHVPQILNELGVAGMSNYEKVKTIHDYVCKLITYKSSDDYIVSTMYGAITPPHQALCNSYSLTLYKLLVEAGIPCKYIGGKAGTGRDAGGHAWNIVALGDHWYCVDATWDDDGDAGVCYDYFLKGSSDFDAADPSQVHTMDAPFTRDPYKSAFPIAKSAFNPELMSDVNTTVTIGGTGGSSDSDDSTLTEDQVIEGTWPESGKFTVKRNKATDLQIFIEKAAGTMIDNVTYKVTAGKSRIKKIKNYGLLNEEGMYFTDLEFYGKKKGKVTIQITLKLINGQTMTRTFTGKVK